MSLLKISASVSVGGAGGGGGGGGIVTVTRASATALPPAPVAFAVYVVEVVGATDRLPDGSTVPTPLSMVTPVAFEEFQESVVELPFSIAAGDALREIVGAGGGGGGGGGCSTTLGAGVGATFFLQPVPKTSMASKAIATTASMYGDLLICSFSF